MGRANKERASSNENADADIEQDATASRAGTERGAR